VLATRAPSYNTKTAYPRSRATEQESSSKPTKPKVPCRDFNSAAGCKRPTCKFGHTCSHEKCIGKNRHHSLVKCTNATKVAAAAKQEESDTK
jgi:hypothetical protein